VVLFKSGHWIAHLSPSSLNAFKYHWDGDTWENKTAVQGRVKEDILKDYTIKRRAQCHTPDNSKSVLRLMTWY